MLDRPVPAMTVPSAAWLGVLDGDAAPSSVATLVAGALRRDAGAERRLYERYAPLLRRFARALVRDPHDASDVVQETFARAFRLLPTLERPAELAPWLHGIARNVCFEHLKARKKTRTAPPTSVHLPGGAEPPSPEHELIGRQAAEVVLRALSAMPAARREALSLRAEHGLAYQDIAALMGWSLSKAKVEVHRARRGIDLALRTPEERRTSRRRPVIFAVLLTLALASVLVGAGPGEPPEPERDAAPLATPYPPPSSWSSDASADEPAMSLAVVAQCDLSAPPTPPQPPPPAAQDIPWSDAPVTKASEVP